MKAELPFEITPTTRRYLRELAEFSEDFPTAVNPRGARIQIYRYKNGEQPTQKSELNINDFWEHLESVGVVKVTYPDKKDFVFQSYSNIDEALAFPQHVWVHVLKPESIRELLQLVEKQLAEKQTKGKVEWNPVTAILRYQSKIHTFQKHDKKDAPKLDVFKVLWAERRGKKVWSKGIPLTIKMLAARASLIDNRREDSLTEDVENQTLNIIKEIRRIFKQKEFPISLKQRGNSFQLEVTE